MGEIDERPPVWVGHVALQTPDLPAAEGFYRALGMREVARSDAFVILEMRGGTHLALTRGEAPDSAGFDLMVDDLDASHARWTEAGLPTSDIRRGDIHDRFTLTDPAGTRLTVFSTHVVGPV